MGSVTGLHAQTPRTHSKWVAGPGCTPQARAVGRGRAPKPGRRTPRREAPPPAPSCRPHSAQSQLARARAVGLVTGPHAQTPRTHCQWVAVPGRTLQGRAVGRGRAPKPGRPTPRRETPPQRAKPAHKRRHARRGASDPKHGKGTKGPGHLSRAKKAEHGIRAGNADGHEPPGRALPAPCTGAAHSARATPTRRGGEGANTAGARAHTHATDMRCGPEGQQDRARGPHRPHGMGYRQAKERDTRARQPATRTARDARAGRSPRAVARTGTSPNPPDLPRAPRTHDQCTAPAEKFIVFSALCFCFSCCLLLL